MVSSGSNANARSGLAGEAAEPLATAGGTGSVLPGQIARFSFCCYICPVTLRGRLAADALR